ncbi:hypothetical protein Cgig2_020034 [Carnegiea gigantea]|uniref:Uncharacterized protein n=1 Tax=Carnegiea gigantea TaxID=171969 RepID=A0A9Q1K376_9CARY|nr:hypothetical protein Cgig2_020034 [Carnegiea gigantea]
MGNLRSDDNERELVSKRHWAIVEEIGEGSCSGQMRTKRAEVLQEVEVEVEVEDTSSGSNYMAESIGGSESLEVEFNFMEDVENLERRLRNSASELQFNGFSLLLQAKVYHGGRYDALELVVGIEEHEGVLSFKERLKRVRAMLREEKDAHATTHAKFESCQAQLSDVVGEARPHLCAAQEEVGKVGAEDTREGVDEDVVNGQHTAKRVHTCTGEGHDEVRDEKGGDVPTGYEEGGSSSCIAKHLKGMTRHRRAAPSWLSPCTNPRR